MVMLILWGHALAALGFAALTLAWSRRAAAVGLHSRMLVAALAVTALWALAVAGIGEADLVTRVVQSLRNLIWLAAMLVLLRRTGAGVAAVYALYAATAGIHPDRPKKGNWLARVAAGGVRKFLTETMHDRIGDASPAHQKWFLDTAEGVTVEHLARFVPLMASEYFPEKLSAVQCPTLMVVPDPG